MGLARDTAPSRGALMASLMMSAVAEEAEGSGDEERWGSGLGGAMTDDRRIYGCRRLMADGEK